MAFGLQTSAHSCIFVYHGTLALFYNVRLLVDERGRTQ